MHRDVRLFLDDILEAVAKIRDYTIGMDYDVFISSEKNVEVTFISIPVKRVR